MKIRSNYVSNSSSSSFIIAYDKNFYGDLEKFFKDGYFGCETEIYELSENFEEGEINDEIKKVKQEGKSVLYFSLDQEYFSILTLLKNVNENNGGDKLKIISGSMED